MEQPSARWRPNSHLMERPHSSSSSLHSAPVDTSWTMNPLGIQTANMHHDQYYSTFQHMARSPRLSEPLMELPSNHLTSPQSRRLYTPIAPQPLEAPRSSGTKRTRDEEDEGGEDIKRRKRSDSNTSAQFELSEEDKLLLQLKEEESMPWKDIAARFQADLGKAYQIPALQMRLKRLRERMRVWTDADVRALRMAQEYWAQNKFDIISQKVSQCSLSQVGHKRLTQLDARVWCSGEVDSPPVRTEMDRDRSCTRTVCTFRAASSTRLCPLHNESGRGTTPLSAIHERPMRMVFCFSLILLLHFGASPAQSALAYGVLHAAQLQ
jgi:hypothetical protein